MRIMFYRNLFSLVVFLFAMPTLAQTKTGGSWEVLVKGAKDGSLCPNHVIFSAKKKAELLSGFRGYVEKVGRKAGEKEEPWAFPPFVDIMGDNKYSGKKTRVLGRIKENYAGFAFPLIDHCLNDYHIGVYPLINEDGDLGLWWAEDAKVAIYLGTRIFTKGGEKIKFVDQLSSVVENPKVLDSVRSQALKAVFEIDPGQGKKIMARLIGKKEGTTILKSALSFSKKVSKGYLDSVLESPLQGKNLETIDFNCLLIATHINPPEERPMVGKLAKLLVGIIGENRNPNKLKICCDLFEDLVEKKKVDIPKAAEARVAGRVAVIRVVRGLANMGRNQEAIESFKKCRWFLHGSEAETLGWKVLLESLVRGPGGLDEGLLRKYVQLIIKEDPKSARNVLLDVLSLKDVGLRKRVKILCEFLSHPSKSEGYLWLVEVGADFCGWLKFRFKDSYDKKIAPILRSQGIPDSVKRRLYLGK